MLQITAFNIYLTFPIHFAAAEMGEFYLKHKNILEILMSWDKNRHYSAVYNELLSYFRIIRQELNINALENMVW